MNIQIAQTYLVEGKIYNIIVNTGHEYRGMFTNIIKENHKTLFQFKDQFNKTFELNPSFIISRYESEFTEEEIREFNGQEEFILEQIENF